MNRKYPEVEVVRTPGGRLHWQTGVNDLYGPTVLDAPVWEDGAFYRAFRETRYPRDLRN